MDEVEVSIELEGDAHVRVRLEVVADEAGEVADASGDGEGCAQCAMPERNGGVDVGRDKEHGEEREA